MIKSNSFSSIFVLSLFIFPWTVWASCLDRIIGHYHCTSASGEKWSLTVNGRLTGESHGAQVGQVEMDIDNHTYPESPIFLHDLIKGNLINGNYNSISEGGSVSKCEKGQLSHYYDFNLNYGDINSEHNYGDEVSYFITSYYQVNSENQNILHINSFVEVSGDNRQFVPLPAVVCQRVQKYKKIASFYFLLEQDGGSISHSAIHPNGNEAQPQVPQPQVSMSQPNITVSPSKPVVQSQTPSAGNTSTDAGRISADRAGESSANRVSSSRASLGQSLRSASAPAPGVEPVATDSQSHGSRKRNERPVRPWDQFVLKFPVRPTDGEKNQKKRRNSYIINP